MVATEFIAPLQESTQLTVANVQEMLQEQVIQADQSNQSQLLRQVFESMAVNGRITLDQLPFVMVGAEVQATAKEIEDAMLDQLPDGDDADALLEFQQVEGLYRHLLQNAADGQIHMEGSPEPSREPPSILTRLRHWNRRRQQTAQQRQTAYEKQMKPTRRLLVMILCISSAISIAVVVFAIVYIWDSSSSALDQNILRDLQLLKAGVTVFGYQTPIQTYTTNMGEMSSLIAQLIQQVAYGGIMYMLDQSVAIQESIISGSLDGWFTQDYTDTVTANAAMTAQWLSLTAPLFNTSYAIELAAATNAGLPAGHEVLLFRGNVTDGSIVYLSPLRYASQCAGVCTPSAAADAPLLAALRGQTGTAFAPDYRSVRVVIGYTFSQVCDAGVAYKIDLATARGRFQGPAGLVVDAVNKAVNAGAQYEVVLSALDSAGNTVLLSQLAECDAACLATKDLNTSPYAAAIGGTPTMLNTVSLTGFPVLDAYGPLPNTGFGVTVQLQPGVISSTTFGGVISALNTINTRLNGTQEVQFALAANASLFDSGSTSAGDFPLVMQTRNSLPGTCGAHCANTSEYLRRAILDCTSGTMTGLDYRGQQVIAGYACVPALQGGIAIKVDQQEVNTYGIDLAVQMADFDSEVYFAGSSTEVLVGQTNPGVAVPQSAADYTILSVMKNCPNCTGLSPQMLSALQQTTGVETAPTYNGMWVVGAYAYIAELGIGLVFQTSAATADATNVSLAWRLAGCSIAAVVISMGLMALLTNRLLRSMDQAWVEGKRAVEVEKQQFCRVIEAMYPPQVARRVLLGETHIVYQVNNACVFFSDIYEFTATCNSLQPEELIHFMSYTFGSMDVAAEHFHVHKVKTIGDAYLGISGLPGTEPVYGGAVQDMLLFANCCAQVFSGRYNHSEDGAILDVASRALFSRRRGGKGPAEELEDPRQRYLPGATPSGDAATDLTDVHCVMRYGVATGPVTAGVLQGKTPLFDVWGKTVNLASRMESTGVPGRIQVSEGVYQMAIKQKAQTFTFDPRHKVFCKGFGHVSAYFINTCHTPPPKALLQRMRIKPNLGHFYFDPAVPGFKAAHKGTNSGPSGSHGSTSDKQSSHSSENPGVMMV